MRFGEQLFFTNGSCKAAVPARLNGPEGALDGLK